MTGDKPIWGIHMERALEMRPITDQFIAIGWEKVGDLSRLAVNRDAYKKAVAQTYPSGKPGAVPVWAGTLFRFATEMKKGDLIVYPSKSDRMVNLGIVQSDYIYDPASDPMYPNLRRVRWLHHLPRTQFSQSALYEIGSAVTLFQVKSNADEFLAAFAGKPLEPTDVDEESFEAASASAEETTRDFVVKRLKSAIDPYQFEQFVGHLLECMGYHARVTQKSGDGGIDIIAHKDELGFEPPIIKVQCKQTLTTIGQPEVSQLYGHIETREHGLFVTLGDYSPPARQFERGKHNLRLISGDDLTALIFTHYHHFEPRYQMLLPLKRVYLPGTVGKESDG